MKITTALRGAALVAALCLNLASQLASATDIAREVRQQQSETTGFFEANTGLQLRRTPIIGANDDNENPENPEVNITLGLSGRLEWRGFFIEAVRESSNNGILGYDAWENENNRVALIFTSQLGEYEPGRVSGYETVRNRKSDLQFGVRSTHYKGNNIIQLELLADVSGRNEGLMASWQFGRYWQIRNWNTHALIGARYFPSQTLDYYIGVDPDEVSVDTPQYQASSGLVSIAEVGAAIPLNENWVFRTSLSAERFPDSVVNSPLVKARISYVAEAGFHYVF